MNYRKYRSEARLLDNDQLMKHLGWAEADLIASHAGFIDKPVGLTTRLRALTDEAQERIILGTSASLSSINI